MEGEDKWGKKCPQQYFVNGVTQGEFGAIRV